MNKKLYVAIGDADAFKGDMLDLEESLQKLSQFPVATAHLINAYQETILNAETLWREIEQTEEFQAQYQNREQAIKDFYRTKLKRIDS